MDTQESSLEKNNVLTFSGLRLPRLISSGMILQRDTELKLWGWAKPGDEVTVNFIEKRYSGTAGMDGKWTITLNPMNAGGPYTMEIKADKTITLDDILIGDVWVCSGQSNMVIPMERVSDLYQEEIAQANNNAIRMFIVPDRFEFKAPQDDVETGKWEAANQDNILRFTAVGYFFAKELFERYQVPIGLIRACVGGSPVEAWMSEEALKEFPHQLEAVQIYKDDSYIELIKKEDEKISSSWYSSINKSDKGLKDNENKWLDTAFDSSDWKSMELPAYFEEAGLEPFNGIIWFRKEVNISEEMAGKPARLLLGRIVDSDMAYVNGVFVGETTYQYPPRRYNIPADVLKEGKNIIVVRVTSKIGMGGFIKDKPYKLIAGDKTIALTGQWQYKIGAIADKPLADPTFFQYKPLGLYNGMLAPLINYTIKGVIWYQGESNAGSPSGYHELFSEMIADWRKKWNQGDFPFLFVQLPNYMEPKEYPSESSWAELRDEQLKTLAVPNTGMAVAIGLGEWNDLHPLNKKGVGCRLALLAQRIAYGDRKIVQSGPIFESARVSGNKVVINFSSCGSGLIVKDGGELKHFAIAGDEGKFSWATAKIEGNKVVLWNEQIAKPAAVRYAWADNPESANLYNKEGLPTAPFMVKL